MAAEDHSPPYVIAVIGAGLYGLSTLERLVANWPEYAPGLDRTVHIHLIDPCLGSGSHTWSSEEPAELWMNSRAGTMTLFTDDSSSCAGPVRKGPTLHEWAAASGKVLSTDVTLDRLVPLSSPHRWASRSLMGTYMGWFLDHVTQSAPNDVRIHRHRKRAVRVISAPATSQGREAVWLADETVPLICHRVVLAQGRPLVQPSPQQLGLQRVLSSYGGSYTPPGQATRSRTAQVEPGEKVLLRGLGLTFFDYLQLFTTVRGGSFHSAAGGGLTYRPSGAEPRIFAMSRTGVPARPARWWPTTGGLTACPTPRFTSPRLFADLAASHDTAAALREATARMKSELLYFYYSELLVSDPDYARVRDRFHRLYPHHEPGSPAHEEFVTSLFAEEDRLDWEETTDPLRGREFQDLESLQAWMRRYVAQNTNRSLSRKHSCDVALLTGLSYLTMSLAEAFHSRAYAMKPEFYQHIWNWVQAKVGALTGGAPWPRQLELQALSRAGVLTFLGKGSRIADDPVARKVRCESDTVPVSVDIAHVIEARQAPPSVTLTSDELLRDLDRRGEITWIDSVRDPSDAASVPQTIAVTRHGGLISRDNSVSRTRYAVGADTSNPILTPGLPRAGTDSDVFHLTDRVARHILASLAPACPHMSPEE
ncbi:FAD/NAD(P)-binding protein [Streptomyces sp. NPDC052309]|uniref:FAD/NAD(P)-binding protein n=1 Tax=Streptomyces sp. NPDC052309 TaxID=3155421 RepID=UPI003416DFB5